MAIIADDAAEAAAARQSAKAAGVSKRTGASQAKTSSNTSQSVNSRGISRQTRTSATDEQGNTTSTSNSSQLKAPRFKQGNGNAVIAGAWFTGLAIITWQEVKANHAAPEPKRFVGWSVAMGILDILEPFVQEVASVIAIGLVVGMLMFRKPSAPEFSGDGVTPIPTSFGLTGGVPQGVPFGGAQAGQSQAGTVQPPTPGGGATAVGSPAGTAGK